MEIRRFGVGNRRPDGPPGTRGVAGQLIHADARGTVSELAFARRGSIEPHSSPTTTWFIIIEGGGLVQVGDTRARVAAGEAVLWPPDVPHAAWTELSEMRAIVVELSGVDDTHLRGILDGRSLAVDGGDGWAGAGAAGAGADAAGAGAADIPARKADGELLASPVDAARSAIEGEPI
ncbi:MAG TPA: cupin domain-containing protein [Patescibacteria group bacterium]|nr:cupin domain-containing protein [Patescibacteria group bacterium]